jgi:hypothetical protein
VGLLIAAGWVRRLLSRRSDMQRYWKLLAPISCGGVTLGWLSAAGMLNFSNIWTDLLSFLFSAIITALVGFIPLPAGFGGGLLG